jgi:Na+-translocating ferredoxin:NAD+ oxidoreductase RnfG subunit
MIKGGWKAQILFVAMALVTAAWPAEGTVYLTKEQALEIAFPQVETVETEKLSLTAEQRKWIADRARASVRFATIRAHIGLRNGHPVGYAFIHNVKGKSRPITFMVVITPAGKIDRVEVLAFRESHGYEIRYPAFRKQFVGKGVEDPIRHRRDILNISGATISCRAIADGVRMLLALWHEIYGVGAEVAK